MWDLEKYSEKPAIIDEFYPALSYGRLYDIGKEIAEIVGGRALVVSLCSNTIGSVAGYISFINHRIVPIMLSVHLEEEMLDNLLSIYCPQFIWLPKEIAGVFLILKRFMNYMIMCC